MVMFPLKNLARKGLLINLVAADGTKLRMAWYHVESGHQQLQSQPHCSNARQSANAKIRNLLDYN